MPTNKKFDRSNPKNRYNIEKGIPVENTPYDGPLSPRFEPERIPGKADETEYALTGASGSGRLGTGVDPAYIGEEQPEPQITVDPLPVGPNHRSKPFYERRAQTVTALNEIVLVRIDTKNAGTYYIKRIGHSFHDTSVEFRLEYDGIIWRRWNYQIGGVAADDMYDLHVALPARRVVKLVVRNNAAESRLYEGVIDGWFAGTAGVNEAKGGFE